MPFQVGAIVELTDNLHIGDGWDEPEEDIGYQGETATVFEVHEYGMYFSYDISFEEQSGFIYNANQDILRSTGRLSQLTPGEMEDIRERFYDNHCASLIPALYKVGQVVNLRSDELAKNSYMFTPANITLLQGKRGAVVSVSEPPRHRLDRYTYEIHVESLSGVEGIWDFSENEIEGTDLFVPESIIQERLIELTRANRSPFSLYYEPLPAIVLPNPESTISVTTISRIPRSKQITRLCKILGHS